MHETPCTLLLCDDLIFTSRIAGTATALALPLRSCKTASELLQFAGQVPPRCVIVDLQAPGLVITDFARALAALSPQPFLVGYGSHVDTATLKTARDAGFDIVWPRSKFVDELPTALPQWLAPPEQPG